MKRAEYERCKAKALEFYEKAGIALTEAEKESVEVAEFENRFVTEYFLFLQPHLFLQKLLKM